MTVETKIGKISGSKETLNNISLYLGYAVTELERKGYDGMALPVKTASHEIYEALEEVGYYK